jgi:UDP-N-acetylglucosamine 2-epimerase (non-hydrolysing)
MRTLDVVKRAYALLTLHRGANVDDRESLVEILEGISELSKLMKVIFPAHPRTQKKICELGLGRYFAESVRIVEPLGYLDFLCLMKHARIVVTDSGGIQEETTALGIPCVTARDNTERPVTIDVGTNLLGGRRRDTIAKAIRIQLASKSRAALPDLWDGRAAARIVGILADRYMHAEAMAAHAGSGQIVQNAR